MATQLEEVLRLWGNRLVLPCLPNLLLEFHCILKEEETSFFKTLV